MNLRLEIATKIYCSYIQSGHTPDIELTFNTADEIIAYAKEPKGFFIEIGKYEKAIEALESIKKNTFQDDSYEIAKRTLEDLSLM